MLKPKIDQSAESRKGEGSAMDIDAKWREIIDGLKGVSPGPYTFSGVRHKMGGAEWQGIYDGRDRAIIAVSIDVRTLEGLADGKHVARFDPDTVCALFSAYEKVKRERDANHNLAVENGNRAKEEYYRAEIAETITAKFKAENERLREALAFYADPPKDEPIPDFYSELDFGDTARAALDPSHTCHHCDQPSVINLDGKWLCKHHADQWVSGEGEAEDMK